MLLVKGLLVNCDRIVYTGSNTACLQDLCPFISMISVRNTNSVLVIDVTISWVHYWSLYDFTQICCQKPGMSNTLFSKLLQFLDLRQSYRSLNLCHTLVISQHHMLIALFLPMAT